ncbi:phage tail assembly chaperone [Pseudomonas sp. S2_D10]
MAVSLSLIKGNRMYWARIESETVAEITDIDPADRFHPDLIWQSCPSEVGLGWIAENGTFTPPQAGPTPEQFDAERVWRNVELQGTEWLVTRHRDEQDLGHPPTLTSEQFAELLTYRQALRDWPQTGDFPSAEYRPVAPPWIAEQTQ